MTNRAVVLMLQRGKEGIVNPGTNEVVSYIDILIIAGNNTDVDRLFEQTENSHGNGEK